MSKLRPILFKGEMVNAILAGRKTQTRRLLKVQPVDEPWDDEFRGDNLIEPIIHHEINGIKGCYSLIDNMHHAPIQPDDVLWVRETWMPFEPEHIIDKKYVYRADCDSEAEERRMDYVRAGYPYKWRPSLFMPYDACRLFLKVTGLRLERLNDISEFDSIAEGVASTPVVTVGSGREEQRYQNYLNRYDIHHPMHRWSMSAKHSYETLWDKINGKGAWSTNPYVWVYEFEVTDKPTAP